MLRKTPCARKCAVVGHTVTTRSRVLQITHRKKDLARTTDRKRATECTRCLLGITCGDRRCWKISRRRIVFSASAVEKSQQRHNQAANCPFQSVILHLVLICFITLWRHRNIVATTFSGTRSANLHGTDPSHFSLQKYKKKATDTFVVQFRVSVRAVKHVCIEWP